MRISSHACCSRACSLKDGRGWIRAGASSGTLAGAWAWSILGAKHNTRRVAEDSLNFIARAPVNF